MPIHFCRLDQRTLSILRSLYKRGRTFRKTRSLCGLLHLLGCARPSVRKRLRILEGRTCSDVCTPRAHASWRMAPFAGLLHLARAVGRTPEHAPASGPEIRPGPQGGQARRPWCRLPLSAKQRLDAIIRKKFGDSRCPSEKTRKNVRSYLCKRRCSIAVYGDRRPFIS